MPISPLVDHLQLALMQAQTPAETELATSMLRRALYVESRNPDFLDKPEPDRYERRFRRLEEMIEELQEDLESKIEGLQGESDMTRQELEIQVGQLRDLIFNQNETV